LEHHEIKCLKEKKKVGACAKSWKNFLSGFMKADPDPGLGQLLTRNCAKKWRMNIFMN
jgi:hypothetical protein